VDRIGRALDRIGRLLDHLIGAALLGGLIGGWLVGIALLAYAKWWLAFVGVALGVPFAIGLYHAVRN